MAGKGGKPAASPPRATLRIDKWLFQARFFRARSLAAEAVELGRCRLNGQRIQKPGHAIGAGDVLTLVQGGRVRVVRVLDLGTRRGPATEAQALYLDLDPPAGETVTPAPLE